MKRTLGGVLILVLFGATAGGDEKAPAIKLSPEEKALLDLLNAARKKEKLPPLTLNATLCQVARAHSENMARQGKFEHTLDGKDPIQRVRDAGYRHLGVGENIMQADAGAPDAPAVSAADIHKAWMDSKMHRENILSKKFTEVGIGVARTKKGIWYYTQVFAVRGRK